jgi:hypothetical protein
MASSALGGIAISAIAGAALWYVLLRHNEEPSGGPPAARSADLTPASRVAPPHAAPSPAASPIAPALAGSAEDPREAAFARESRDAAWAAPIEDELRERYGQLAGTVLEVECRTQQCRLAILGDERAIGQAIEALRGARGVHDLDATIALTAPVKRDDGTLALHAFALFTR